MKRWLGISPPFRDTRPRVSVQGVASLPASASSPAPSSLSVHVVDFSWAEHSLWPMAWRPGPFLVWGGPPQPLPIPSVPLVSILLAGSCLLIFVHAVPSAQDAFTCSLTGTQLRPPSGNTSSMTSHCSQPGRTGALSLLHNAPCTPSFHRSRCRDCLLT